MAGASAEIETETETWKGIKCSELQALYYHCLHKKIIYHKKINKTIRKF